MEPEPR